MNARALRMFSGDELRDLGGSPSPMMLAHRFRDVMGHFLTGVSVVATRNGGQLYGATVSSIASLCLEPPTVLVCLNAHSTTCEAVRRTKSFAVNILAAEQTALAARFARSGGDKFREVEMLDGFRDPWIGASLAHLQCCVVRQIAHGTHVIFIAEVDRAAVRDGDPLTYYGGVLGDLGRN